MSNKVDPYMKQLLLKRMADALRKTIEHQRSKSVPEGLFVVVNDHGLMLNDATGTFSYDIMGAAKVPEEFDPKWIGGAAVLPVTQAAEGICRRLEEQEELLLEALQCVPDG